MATVLLMQGRSLSAHRINTFSPNFLATGNTPYIEESSLLQNAFFFHMITDIIIYISHTTLFLTLANSVLSITGEISSLSNRTTAIMSAINENTFLP